jgi:transposase
VPCSVCVFNESKFLNENLALGQLIENSIGLKESVVVFDRGLKSRNSFESFTEKEIQFIGRSDPQYYCKVKSNRIPPKKPKNSTVTITKDETGFLRGRNLVLTKKQYRLISGTIDKSGESICFVTNQLEEDAYTIAATYKQRWEIEVFFKFIKQHLNVTHLVSRQKNGIEVMIYMTMIVAILILAFKKLNNIEGYKIAKLKFEIQLDNLLIKEIVLLCGGNPDKAPHLWNTS